MIKVLIIEDDPMVSQLNKRYVESVPRFKVVGMFQNGHEALNYLRNHSVDLVILDVYMPKLDGIGLLNEMRRRALHTDVIMVTAAKDAESVDKILKLGAVDYLIKPFEYERMKTALENYANRHDLLKAGSVIDQGELDQITNQLRGGQPAGRHQKGIHKKTLEKIQKFMAQNPPHKFTSEEVAERLQISRVTVRRYLEYLQSLGEINLEVEYGSIGRPSHVYSLADPSSKN